FNIDSCSVFMSYHVSPPHLDPPSFPTRRSSDLGLKRWDLRASKQPDYFIANSQFVAARIKRAYGREATVIPPPIDVSRFQIAETTGDYFLVLSRLLAYKRIDLAVAACTRLKRPLIVIGDGPARA